MQQKSYQKLGTVGTVLAVLVSLALAALKWCGLLAFSWWWVIAPVLFVGAVYTVAFLILVAFLMWIGKEYFK